MLCLTLLVLLHRCKPQLAVAAVSDRRNQPFSGWRNSLNQYAAARDRRYNIPNFLATELRYIALAAVLAILLVTSLSCGGGNSGGGIPSPSPESGTVTITGTSTSISHSTTMSVSVS
jgi:preprotein translocase subunit SecG